MGKGNTQLLEGKGHFGLCRRTQRSFDAAPSDPAAWAVGEVYNPALSEGGTAVTAPDLKPTFEFNEQIASSLMKTRRNAEGLHEYLGFKTIDVGPGTMQCQFEVRAELLTPIGNMHGGVLSAFCDHLLGTVCYPVIKRGQWAATTEFKINLTRPVTQGCVDGYARIVNLGRTQAVVQIDVHNDGRICALAQGTVTIMDPR